jgi:hypothetical protein
MHNNSIYELCRMYYNSVNDVGVRKSVQEERQLRRDIWDELASRIPNSADCECVYDTYADFRELKALHAEYVV